MKALFQKFFGNFSLGGIFATFLLYGLLAAVFGWTMSLTIGLASQVFPNNYWAQYFAVALFDGGAITWMLVFIKKAKGLPQRILALLLCVADTLGMCIVSGVEIVLGGQKLVTIGEHVGETALAVVIIWTIINAVGGLLFHVLDLGVLKSIFEKSSDDVLDIKILTKYHEKLEEVSDAVAEEKANLKREEKLQELHAQHGVQHYIPAPTQPVIPALPENGHKNEPIVLNRNNSDTTAPGNPT